MLEAMGAKQDSFIAAQARYNAKQDSFNADQTSHNAKQDSFNAVQASHNAKQDTLLSNLVSAVNDLLASSFTLTSAARVKSCSRSSVFFIAHRFDTCSAFAYSSGAAGLPVETS